MDEKTREYMRDKQREHRAKKKLMQNGGTTEAKAITVSVKSNSKATVTIHLD